MTAIKLRTQNDGLSDKLSIDTAISFPPEENQTRAEFAQDADINNLLSRYGAEALLPANTRGIYGGHVNFDDDLTTAFEAIERAKDAHAALPADVKKLYPTWEALAREIARGDANPALGKDLAEKIKAAEDKEQADKLAALQKASAAAGNASSPAGDGASTSGARQ